MFRYQLVRTVNGGKPRKHVPRLRAKVNLVLTLIPLSFLPVLSLPSLSSPSVRFFATLLSPSKLSRLTAKPSVNNFPLHYANASNPIGTECLRLIRLCRNVADLKPMMSVLIVKGLVQHEFIIGEFLRTCFHLGAPDLALSLFRRIEKPNLVLQNLMIRCLCNNCLYKEVLFLYLSCWVSGCPSDDFTFPFVIKACSALNALWTGKEVHCVVLRTGLSKI